MHYSEQVNDRATIGVAIVLSVLTIAFAVSMSLLSVTFAYTLARGPLRRRFPELIPLLGCAGVVFGLWYSLGALQGHL